MVLSGLVSEIRSMRIAASERPMVPATAPGHRQPPACGGPAYRLTTLPPSILTR